MFRRPLSVALVSSLVVLLAACGQEVSPVYEAGAGPVTERQGPQVLPGVVPLVATDPVRLQRGAAQPVSPVSSARGLVARQPEPRGVEVAVDAQPAWSALTLVGLVAVPGCGWYPIASATAVPSNGQVAFSFAPKDPQEFSGGQNALFFFVDHDGDGQCDSSKGDEVFTAELGPLQAGGAVTVALAGLTASPDSCSLFSYLP